MKLYTSCPSCKKEIPVKHRATDRGQLQMNVGDEIRVNCMSCGTIARKHINEVRAQPNNTLILIGLGLGLIATAILWTIFGGIGTVSMAIPLLIWVQQSNATNTFNKFMIRRK